MPVHLPRPAAGPPPTDAATGTASDGRTDGRRPMVRAEEVRKSFGRLEVLRGIDLEVAPRRGDVHHRAVRARASPRSCAASTTWRRSTPAGSGSTASSSATGRCSGKLHELRDREICPQAGRDRHGVPALQPVPAHDRAAERHRGAAAGAGRAKRAAVGAGPRAARPGRPRRQGATPTPPSCPAASSSASPSPGRWPCSPS